jgi:single-strand DNA-binding protein
MASLNSVTLIGNLTSDPVLKTTDGGTAYTRFDIAINRKFKNPDGTMHDEVTFVPCITWGARAEPVAKYLAKGRSVAVQGRLRIDSFVNNEGQKVKVVEVVTSEVVFLGSKPNGSDDPSDAAEPVTSSPASTEPQGPEVPF